uniref:Uncharacterized protein n=1 Tax=Arundo donax TaxID=35708 RepID=A0A0A9BVB6_ARUDO
MDRCSDRAGREVGGWIAAGFR